MLTIDLETFVWERPKSRRKGYAWQGSGDDMQLAPVPGVRFEKYRLERKKSAASAAGLFRTFADVEETPGAILEFANRFGSLRERLEFCPLSVWKQQIALMRQQVQLQDALDAGDWKAVRDNLARFRFDVPSVMAVQEKLAGGKMVLPDELVNAAVSRLVFPVVNTLKYLEWEGVLDKKTVQLRLKHPDLQNFLWFQFGHALIGGLGFDQCRVCKTWFRIDPKVSRADRITCSDSCRFQRYRQRMRRAAELNAQGWPVKKIAKELATDTNSIKTWIQKGSAP